MKTSCFAKNIRNKNAISIAIYAPRFYKGLEYIDLAPTSQMLKQYKQDGDKEAYTIQYMKILNKLDAKEVYETLREMVEGEPVLLCWEGKDKFCHRHLAAKWFEQQLNLEIKEIE